MNIIPEHGVLDFHLLTMFPELNTVFSVSSVLMYAVLNKDNVHSIQQDTVRREELKPQEPSLKSDVKYFNPHPNIVASGLCSYKYFINKVENRIPGKTIQFTILFSSMSIFIFWGCPFVLKTNNIKWNTIWVRNLDWVCKPLAPNSFRTITNFCLPQLNWIECHQTNNGFRPYFLAFWTKWNF